MGFSAIKGFHKADLERLLTARDTAGPFLDPQDLQVRARISPKGIELLARAEASDQWAPDGDRTRLIWDSLSGLIESKPDTTTRKASLGLPGCPSSA